MNTFTADRNNYRRKLIMLVKQYPILWNKSQENYNRNRPLKIQAWQEISEQLGISVVKLRRTWENLRDQYRRDLKREMKYGFKSKWRFFTDMDFIRAMVQCKVSQNEYTDSDSELDQTQHSELDQTPHLELEPTQQLKQTQCSVITTNLATNTTSTITTRSQFFNSESANSPVPFQPIVLSKNWQLGKMDIPQQANVFSPSQPTTNCLPTVVNCAQPEGFEVLEYVPDCDSSKAFHAQEQQQAELMEHLNYENIAKQEPDLDLESESLPPPPYKVEISSNYLNSTASQDAEQSQEPSVSTSCHKRSRMSMEESSNVPKHTVAKVSQPTETDFDIKDDDYYFVMSLLPSLRQIPRNRKFPVRLGIMNLIAKDLEEVVKAK